MHHGLMSFPSIVRRFRAEGEAVMSFPSPEAASHCPSASPDPRTLEMIPDADVKEAVLP